MVAARTTSQGLPALLPLAAVPQELVATLLAFPGLVRIVPKVEAHSGTMAATHEKHLLFIFKTKTNIHNQLHSRDTNPIAILFPMAIYEELPALKLFRQRGVEDKYWH